MTELIFALDVPDAREADRWVELLGRDVAWFKVGLELFIREGAQVVENIAEKGKNVFLDLKLHDIPRTVERAVAQAASTGAAMMTIHASGGAEMMEAAALSAASCKNPPKLVAVTVLTSLDAHALGKIGVRRDPRKWAIKLAKEAKDAGVDGVVSSPGEIKGIKNATGRDFLVVTPGIRMPDSVPDDQKRTATPAEARRRGADFIVVGRPIRDASDPLQAAVNIKKMISD